MRSRQIRKMTVEAIAVDRIESAKSFQPLRLMVNVRTFTSMPSLSESSSRGSERPSTASKRQLR